MELGAEVGIFHHLLAEFFGDHPGLQAAQTDPQVRHRLTDGSEKLRHGGLAGKIHAPAGNLDAGDDNFLVALLLQFLCLLHRQLQGRGAHGATGIGDDAVGAEVHAAVLDLQHGPGPLLQTARGKDFKFSPAQGVVQGFLVSSLGKGSEHILDKFLPLAAAAQNIHTQFPDGFGGMLGIAAADADDGLGMLPAAPPDHGPVLLVRHGGDGAGVDDIAVARLVKMTDFMAHFRQNMLHGLGFVLICLAAKGIKCQFHCHNHQFVFLKIVLIVQSVN